MEYTPRFSLINRTNTILLLMSEPSSGGSLHIYLRLLSYVKPYIGYFVLSIFGLTIFASTQPIFAKLLEYFVQALEGQPIGIIQHISWLAKLDATELWLLPALIMLTAILRGISSYLGNYYIAKVSTSVIHDLRTHMFKQMVTLPKVFFDNNNSGHLISRIIYNVSQVTEAASEAIRVMVREGLTVIFLLTFLIYTNWKLTMIFIVITPLIALMVSVTSKMFRKISKNIQFSMGDLTHATSETINGYQEVRGYGGEDHEKERFTSVSAKNASQVLAMERTVAISTPLLQCLVFTSLAILMFMILLIKGDASTASLIGYLTAAGMMNKPIRQLSEINSSIQKGITAAETIFEMIDEEPERNQGKFQSKRVKGKVEFNNVSFTYHQTEQPALKDITFSMNPGETYALVGRSGSGKTTLANLLPRFYNYDQGQILIDDTPIGEYELKNLRSHIALVSQNVTLFNDTIARNIAYGILRETTNENDVRMATEAAYASKFIKNMPNDIHTVIGENGVLLSGGQCQRLAIARAILKDAPILILDEATSALDTESERYIQNALDNVMKNRTTLVIAHRLSTIENADRILVMDQGRIIEQGSHSELMAQGEHYAKLHKLQFYDDLSRK